MSSPPVHPGIRFESAKLQDSKIVTELLPDELFDIIDNKEIVIFKEIWPKEEIKALRNEILAWARETEVWPQGVSAGQPGVNFHRVDDGSISGRLPHIFHQFGFGDFDRLPESLRSRMMPVAEAMVRKMNEIAGTNLKFDGGDVRIKVIRHPRGGGHLVWHRHPYLPQKVEFFLNLSQPGEDYHCGGADFKTPAGAVGTCDCCEMGDIIAWRYDLPHRTATIDPDADLNWDGDDGFWLLAVEVITAHDHSHVEDESKPESK
jgi:hypothetical protein